MQTNPTNQDPLSNLPAELKQFLYVLFKDDAQWPFVYKAWTQAPKVNFEIVAGYPITAIYTRQDLRYCVEDLIEEAASSRPSQAIPKKLSNTGINGWKRMRTAIRDNTYEVVEIPFSAVTFTEYDPLTMQQRELYHKNYVFLWPDAVDTDTGERLLGFVVADRKRSERSIDTMNGPRARRV